MTTSSNNLKVRSAGAWVDVVKVVRSAGAWVSATGSGLTGYNGFGAGNWPDASWRAYSSTSPFNVPINTSVDVVHPNSTAIVAAILAQSGNPSLPVGNLVAGNADTTGDYGHPLYFSQADDPIFTLQATEPWGPNELNGMQIRVPDPARPAGGTDGHMCIVTPDGWEYDLWAVSSKPAGGGTLEFGWGGRTRIDGSGIGGLGTASGFGLIAGTIRAIEFEQGLINHALFSTVALGSVDLSFGYGVSESPNPSTEGTYVYPAIKGDARGPAGSNLPPMGARFWLDMTTTEINALVVPDWKKTILKALSKYGAYFGDTGGPGFAFQFESGSTYTSFGQPDPMVTYAQSATGVSLWQGEYVFNMSDGVDWANKLKVVIPPAQP